MDNNLKWQNNDLKLPEAFDNGEIENLLKFAENNQLILMSEFIDESDLTITLKYGSAVMNQFEAFIKKNPMFYALFKLGELNGHLACINRINYEKQSDNLVKTAYENLKAYHPGAFPLMGNILKKLYSTGTTTSADELAEYFSESTISILYCLHYLHLNGFVYHCGLADNYSLTDTGHRVAKQL